MSTFYLTDPRSQHDEVSVDFKLELEPNEVEQTIVLDDDGLAVHVHAHWTAGAPFRHLYIHVEDGGRPVCAGSIRVSWHGTRRARHGFIDVEGSTRIHVPKDVTSAWLTLTIVARSDRVFTGIPSARQLPPGTVAARGATPTTAIPPRAVRHTHRISPTGRRRWTRAGDPGSARPSSDTQWLTLPSNVDVPDVHRRATDQAREELAAGGTLPQQLWDALIAVLTDPQVNDQVRHETARALASLNERGEIAGEVWTALVDVIVDRDLPEPVRAAAATALGGIEDDRPHAGFPAPTANVSVTRTRTGTSVVVAMTDNAGGVDVLPKLALVADPRSEPRIGQQYWFASDNEVFLVPLGLMLEIEMLAGEIVLLGAPQIALPKSVEVFVPIETMPRAAAPRIVASIDVADEHTRAAWGEIAHLPKTPTGLSELILERLGAVPDDGTAQRADPPE